MSAIRVRVVIGAALLALAGAGAGAAAQTDGLRAAMRGIYDGLRALLELSAQGRYADPGNDARVYAAIRAITDQGVALSEHVGVTDPESAFLAESLQRYASLVRRTREWHQYRRSESLLYDLTAVCIGCHTRVPGAVDARITQGFVRSASLESLPPARRARLLVALRRFDDALGVYEKAVLNGPADPGPLAELVREHVAVSVRVRHDFARPARLVEALLRRGDLDAGTRREAGHWLERLRALRHRPPDWSSLASARSLVHAAPDGAAAHPGAGMVDYVTASAVLENWLAEGSAGGPRRAEAYYLLGLCEDRLGASGPLPKAELYLENAVLTAPGTTYAREAYALLDRRMRRTFERSPAHGMPPEIRQHLDRLKALVGE